MWCRNQQRGDIIKPLVDACELDFDTKGTESSSCCGQDAIRRRRHETNVPRRRRGFRLLILAFQTPGETERADRPLAATSGTSGAAGVARNNRGLPPYSRFHLVSCRSEESVSGYRLNLRNKRTLQSGARFVLPMMRRLTTKNIGEGVHVFRGAAWCAPRNA